MNLFLKELDERLAVPALPDLRFPIFRCLADAAIRFGHFGMKVTWNGHTVKIVATREKKQRNRERK